MTDSLITKPGFLGKYLEFDFMDWDILESIEIIRATLAPLRLTRWQMFKYMVASLFRGWSTLSLVVFVFGSLAVTLLISNSLQSRQAIHKLGLPVVGSSKEHKLDFEQTVEEGKRLYPDTPYIVRTSGMPYVVFPSHVFDEIKKLPERVASAQDYFFTAYFGQHTTAGTETATLLKTLSVDLARSIPTKVRSRQEDAKHAIEEAIGECWEWKEVKLFPAITTVIAQMNACAFFGRDVGRSKRWVNLVSKFPFEIMVATFAISPVPRILQKILAPLIYAPAIITKWRMKWAIAPVIKQDMKNFQNASDKRQLLTVTEHGKVPFTASLMTRYKPEEATLSQLLQDYITISFESTPSSAAALYLLLRELATHPELLDLLRQELSEVMVDGKLPKTHLSELRKMDSVMRESARANPFSLVALYRLLRVPTQFSVGPPLPAGTLICCDVHHINNSAKLWNEPEQFDGLRFYNIRQQPGMENKYQFVSTGSDSPGWGDGLMACPGRMFANSTIKIALAHLIHNYDFKFVEGQSTPIKTSLPNGSWNPGLDTNFMFRARKPDARNGV